MNQKPNYGNWVPEKLLYLTFGGAALFLVLALLSGLAFSNTPLAVICAFSAPFCSPSASICMRATNALPLEKAI